MGGYQDTPQFVRHLIFVARKEISKIEIGAGRGGSATSSLVSERSSVLSDPRR
jgi:hypothetical protein